jgi:hypothetical protein
MKLEEILDLWDLDAPINEIILDEEVLKTPKLHGKYLRLYAMENLLYNKMVADLKILKQEKYDFYIYGVDNKSDVKKWKVRPEGKTLKSDIERILEGDQDLIDASLAISYQKEKVNTLKAILDLINNRGFHINTAANFKKWSSGQ